MALHGATPWVMVQERSPWDLSISSDSDAWRAELSDRYQVDRLLGDVAERLEPGSSLAMFASPAAVTQRPASTVRV